MPTANKAIFEEIIEKFENEKFNKNESKKFSGVVYTPIKITDFIVNNLFIIYLKNLYNLQLEFSKEIDLKYLNHFFSQNQELKKEFSKKIQNIKILDPSCGSGRFLISSANLLFKIYRFLYPEMEEYDVRNQIIQKNLHGIDIDKKSCLISKIRLFLWLFSSKKNILNENAEKIKNLKLDDFDHLCEDLNIKFNIYNLDFLLDFNLDEKTKFNFIIGNPPYIENKKIKDLEYKKKLYKNFKSAFKLFDLSILFLEKSLEVMSDTEGFLSFLLTNKFLSADYGIKIRKVLIDEVKFEEIVNISSLPVFKNTAAYPIILSFQKCYEYMKNMFLIKKYERLEDLQYNNHYLSKKISQDLLRRLPANVIPISGQIDIVKYLYSNYKPMSQAISDLKIIYRPYGFLNWAKHFKAISDKKESDKDLLLLGTGNVGKYHIKFKKRIRIAKNDLEISYFNYNEDYNGVWKNLQGEKLIFREIAKDLTCIYDLGVFTNITGLYFIKIPSFNTDELFCLSTILNSTLLDSVFKTLFGTLHMAEAYLRFNGSFIKRLPMPNKFPISLSYLGKILNFLSQLIYNLNNELNIDLLKDINLPKIEKNLFFYKRLANTLINLLYFKKKYLELNLDFSILEDILDSKFSIPDIDFKNIETSYNLPKLRYYTKEEIILYLNEISDFYEKFYDNKKLIKQFEAIFQKIHKI